MQCANYFRESDHEISEKHDSPLYLFLCLTCFHFWLAYSQTNKNKKCTKLTKRRKRKFFSRDDKTHLFNIMSYLLSFLAMLNSVKRKKQSKNKEKKQAKEPFLHTRLSIPIFPITKRKIGRKKENGTNFFYKQFYTTK